MSTISLTSSGTANITVPSVTDTAAVLGSPQTFTAAQTYTGLQTNTGGAVYDIAGTVASGASATLDDVVIEAATTTVTGTTHITTATGFNKVSIYRPTITDSSAVTIDSAAALYIQDAPLASGSVSITNPYALWVDAGTARFDGTIVGPDGTAWTSSGFGAIVNHQGSSFVASGISNSVSLSASGASRFNVHVSFAGILGNSNGTPLTPSVTVTIKDGATTLAAPSYSTAVATGFGGSLSFSYNLVLAAPSSGTYSITVADTEGDGGSHSWANSNFSASASSV